MAYTIEEEVEELKRRCELLEMVIKDMMDVFIHNIQHGEDYGGYVGVEISDLKSSFESLLEDE